ncbi:MAG: YceH family protein [Solirubrobacteraceae bacterium]
MRPTWISTLSAPETRVLGCLLEKQRTTPDAYPLSLNALRLACNQSTNREPVVDYDEAIIRDALHRLERRGLTRLASGAGSRAAKYRHLLAEALPMDAGEQAVVCVLMLRGPQTPGELKQRTERMHSFGALDGVHETLERLIERELVERLERRPGQKEERYSQLLQDDEAGGQAPSHAQPSARWDSSSQALASSHVAPGAPAPAEPQAASTPEHPSPIADLYERVQRLEREVAELRAQTRDPVGETHP